MENFKAYSIKAGNHYCTSSGLSIISPNVKISFKLDASCLYDESQIISGWNKLWGFGEMNNQQNSCRVGWRSVKVNDVPVGFKLCSYCHVNGSSHIVKEFSGTFLPNQEIYGDLYWENNNYVVKIANPDGTGVQVQLTPQTRKPSWLTFQQYFYFGGQSVAPHNMILYLRKR